MAVWNLGVGGGAPTLGEIAGGFGQKFFFLFLGVSPQTLLVQQFSSQSER